MTQADNIRPYAVFGMFRDVEDAVPYAVIQKYIHSPNPNLYNNSTTKKVAQLK